jgi:flagellar hook assembly protein FlgD
MSVYSVKGERVRRLETTNYRQGGGRILWDGRDDAGHALPSGTYLVRVSANHSTATQRVTIIH